MKRGRPSAAALSVVPIHANMTHVSPPPNLTAAEARLFRELVASCHPQHFVASDVHLLVSYVQATLASRHWAKLAAKDPKLILQWDRATRMQCQLASRLRLSPHSRANGKSVKPALTWED